jgi:hypothetical protein
MGAPNQNQNQNQNQQAPSGADKFFASADHHMVGGRIGVDVAAGGLGAAAVFGLAHKGIGPFEKSPAHLVGGIVGGVVIAEGARALTVDKKKYTLTRLAMIGSDQEKWQKVADETK